MADLMALRRRILLAQQEKRIDGLIVLYDNTFLGSGGSKRITEALYTDPDYFVTGFYATAGTESASYTFYYNPKPASAHCYIRWYNAEDGKAVKYWGASTTAGTKTRTVTASGALVVASIYKPYAKDAYMYDNTNKMYVYKGTNV